MATTTQFNIMALKDPFTKLPPANPVKVTFEDGETSFWEARTVELGHYGQHLTFINVMDLIANPRVLKTDPITCPLTKRTIVKIEQATGVKKDIIRFLALNKVLSADDVPITYAFLLAHSKKVLDVVEKQVTKHIEKIAAQALKNGHPVTIKVADAPAYEKTFVPKPR